MGTPIHIPDGATVLAADGKGGTGNVLLLFEQMDPPRVLKVYRTRRSAFREALRSFSQQGLEGKTGSRPRDRYATEKRNQWAWKNAGVNVIKVVDLPIPAGISDPALWMEYVPAADLQTVLKESSPGSSHRAALLEHLGRDTSQREAMAYEQNNPALVHEHATLNHFFVREDDLIAFDLENGYRDGFPVLEALSQELSTMLRSISRLDPESAERDMAAFLDGYEDKDLLKRILDYGVNSPGFRRVLKRRFDRKTRPGKSKTDVMENALQMLNRGRATSSLS